MLWLQKQMVCVCVGKIFDVVFIFNRVNISDQINNLYKVYLSLMMFGLQEVLWDDVR